MASYIIHAIVLAQVGSTPPKDQTMNLGRILVSPGVEENIQKRITSGGWLVQCLMRHMQGDWGTIEEHDRAVNAAAIQHGSRVLSRYPLSPAIEDQFLFIITDPGHEQTTVLLPEEY